RGADAAAKALRGGGGRPGAGDVGALVENLAARRRQEMGQEVEAGGLAGAVRPDQRVYGAAPHLQLDAVDRDKTLELLGQSASFENDVFGHARSGYTDCPDSPVVSGDYPGRSAGWQSKPGAG